MTARYEWRESVKNSSMTGRITGIIVLISMATRHGLLPVNPVVIDRTATAKWYSVSAAAAGPRNGAI